jgi:hypothetical protein
LEDAHATRRRSGKIGNSMRGVFESCTVRGSSFSVRSFVCINILGQCGHGVSTVMVSGSREMSADKSPLARWFHLGLRSFSGSHPSHDHHRSPPTLILSLVSHDVHLIIPRIAAMTATRMLVRRSTRQTDQSRHFYKVLVFNDTQPRLPRPLPRDTKWLALFCSLPSIL